MTRNYNYTGELTIKKSRVLTSQFPREDIVEWLFLIVGEKRFTFFYKIWYPAEAVYNIPFNVGLSFLMDDIHKYIDIGKTYDVWRAEEPVGKIKILSDTD